MLHIITSNRIPVSSLKDYTENFIICHKSKTAINVPYRDIAFQHQFSIYIQSGMESQIESEDYISTIEEKFEEYQAKCISDVLEDIGGKISSNLLCENSRLAAHREGAGEADRKLVEEPMIICACDPSWNRMVHSYLNNYFKKHLLAKHGIAVECLNLYAYLKMVNDDTIKRMLKNILNTDFIYPEEPVSFSYALDRAMVGLV